MFFHAIILAKNIKSIVLRTKAIVNKKARFRSKIALNTLKINNINGVSI